ncbi:MAG: hypothetical protein HFE64_01635 [Lachnospiraceae bacterium]|jgi:vacuolar-type H+-ATPase subunit H|nr:hypothetical protein [Lachnospiraceae bacterium]
MKTFSTERRGYNINEVNQWGQELETKLENQEKQLAEYRQKEAAINESVVEARLLANKIIEEAKTEAEKIHQDSLDSMTDIKAQLTAMREKLTAFQNDYNHALQQYLVAVRCTDMVKLFDDLDQFMEKLGLNKPEEDAVELTELQTEEKA